MRKKAQQESFVLFGIWMKLVDTVHLIDLNDKTTCSIFDDAHAHTHTHTLSGMILIYQQQS